MSSTNGVILEKLTTKTHKKSFSCSKKNKITKNDQFISFLSFLAHMDAQPQRILQIHKAKDKTQINKYMNMLTVSDYSCIRLSTYF